MNTADKKPIRFLQNMKLPNAVLFVILGVIVGLTVSGRFGFTPQQAVSEPITPLPAPNLEQQNNFFTAVQNVAEKLGPAVVSIHVEQTERFQAYNFGGPFQDDLFKRFFEDFFGEIPNQEFRRSGFGSGVIIDKEGYILTNEHVVESADKIMVTLPDGRKFKATVKGTDPRSDLAVIKVDASDLPFVTLGNSDGLRIGEWVVAIGNPFAHLMSSPEPTVTTGVISALHRSLPSTSRRRNSDYTDLIQTDAAINPGNSGGPLVNLQGEVIGINVAIFSTSGGYEGIGFAIPINDAKRIIEKLIAGKEITYGWIGVSIQKLDQRLAEYFGLPNTKGVLVSKVLKDGPAEKAGIRDGDVILSVNGKTIDDVPALLKAIGTSPIGQKAAITVLRDKKRISVPVTVGQRPTFDEEGEVIEPTEDKEETDTKETETKWRGFTLHELTPEIRSRLRGGAEATGVVVTHIEDDSPAQEAGLRPGDLITAVNNKPIKNIQEFNQAVKQIKHADCLIRTSRGYFVIKSKTE